VSVFAAGVQTRALEVRLELPGGQRSTLTFAQPFDRAFALDPPKLAHVRFAEGETGPAYVDVRATEDAPAARVFRACAQVVVRAGAVTTLELDLTLAGTGCDERAPDGGAGGAGGGGGSGGSGPVDGGAPPPDAAEPDNGGLCLGSSSCQRAGQCCSNQCRSNGYCQRTFIACSPVETTTGVAPCGLREACYAYYASDIPNTPAGMASTTCTTPGTTAAGAGCSYADECVPGYSCVLGFCKRTCLVGSMCQIGVPCEADSRPTHGSCP
jgi:hypothetical protein